MTVWVLTSWGGALDAVCATEQAAIDERERLLANYLVMIADCHARDVEEGWSSQTINQRVQEQRDEYDIREVEVKR